jgi:hypothetical protein
MSEFQFHVGTKLKDKHVAKYVDAAQSWLLPDEHFVALFWTNSIKPMMNAVVVTNARIAGISNADLQNPAKAFRNAISLADIKDVQLEKGRFSAGPKVRVGTSDGEHHGYGEIKEDDAEALRRQLESVIGVPSEVAQAASAAADSNKRRMGDTEATYKRLLRPDQRLFGVLELRKLADEITSDETLVNLATGTLALDNDARFPARPDYERADGGRHHVRSLADQRHGQHRRGASARSEGARRRDRLGSLLRLAAWRTLRQPSGRRTSG